MTDAILHTSMGDVAMSLFDTQAPATVANFVGLATGSKTYYTPNPRGTLSGPFYDGSVFHSVLNGFLIQGGDPTGTGKEGPGYVFDNEPQPGLNYGDAYMVGMANRGPNTNGSQFFITYRPMTHLNNINPVLGMIADPTARLTLLSIANVAIDSMGKPVVPVVINTVEII